MKTANVRQLRHDFGSVLRWVAQGEQVEISKRGKVIAVLSPPRLAKARKLVKPDILAQLKEVWGNRVFSATEVAAMRAAELEGEEG
jgi:prevent-host-death family protein